MEDVTPQIRSRSKRLSPAAPTPPPVLSFVAGKASRVARGGGLTLLTTVKMV